MPEWLCYRPGLPALRLHCLPPAVHRSVTVPVPRGERSAAAAAATGILPGHHSRSQPSTPLRCPLPSSTELMGLDVAGESHSMHCRHYMHFG
jgi:hypothetical protein